MNCRKSLALLLCMLCLSVTAQQLGSWRLHLSYYIATKSEAGGSTIYSLMNGNLLSYDTEDGEVRTYDHMDILSDAGIAYIAYSNEADKLLIVYNNGNIDLLDKDDNVQNLSSLKDKTMLNKEVANVSIAGSMAYLATGFGFVEVDMKEGVFRNTYRLPYTIHCITASDEAVFIGTPEGIRYCKKEDNMQLAENWKMFQDWPNIKNMCLFQGKLIFTNDASTNIYAADPAKPYSTKLIKKMTKINFLKEFNNQLVWIGPKEICFTSDVSGTDPTTLGAAVTTISYENNWSDVSHVNGTYWMSEQEKGLRGYKMSGNEFIPTEEVIQPSSPIRDLGYNVSWAGDRLLVAGGINTVSGFKNPATSMYYENGEWTNFTELETTGRFAKVEPVNTTDLVQDPLDNTHHFASLYRSGLCEYKDGKFVELYNAINSPLRSGLKTAHTMREFYRQVFCSALSYDAEGNLWMAQSMLDTTFYVRKPDGKWLELYYENFRQTSLIDKILHHSSGIKLVSSRRLEKRGVFCIDMKGTERTTDDKTRLLQDFVNQDNTPYLPDQFFCLYEDLDGMVWVGTSAGLFVIEDVTKVFDKDFYFTQIKINRNDGSGLADYLFNDVAISCIAIDAANRKWIGTQANGAYLISADGQEMLHHFTTEDSPLLSNNVQSIAVHPGTGEVAFGTDKGICTFISDATTPEEELEKSNVVVFPNPVTPDYNGPIAIRGLVENSEVKIISTGGQLVWNGTSSGGTCTWNGVANNGKPVASGIYHVVANTPEGGKAIMTRIVIVR